MFTWRKICIPWNSGTVSRVLTLSRRWYFKSRSVGLWCRVVFFVRIPAFQRSMLLPSSGWSYLGLFFYFFGIFKEPKLQVAKSFLRNSHSTNSPPFVNPKVSLSCSVNPISNQMNRVHIFPPYFSAIKSHIIFSSMAKPSKCTLTLRSSDWNFVRIPHLYDCYMPCPSYITQVLPGRKQRRYF